MNAVSSSFIILDSRVWFWGFFLGWGGVVVGFVRLWVFLVLFACFVSGGGGFFVSLVWVFFPVQVLCSL